MTALCDGLCSYLKSLTMILNSLVLQVAEPHHNLLEQASCCRLLQQQNLGL